MLNKIPLKLAINLVLILLSLIVIFHLLVIAGLLPSNIVWGGRIENREELIKMEALSIAINLLLIFTLVVKGGQLRLKIPVRLLDFVIWLFVLLFALNTIGNLLSKTTTETIIFTPLTFILAILCFRIVRKEKS